VTKKKKFYNIDRCSKEAHSCVEKAAMIGFVKLRILEPDENCSLRGFTLREVSCYR
jgi:Pyridoxal-dependent decarboxylase conserved domain